MKCHQAASLGFTWDLGQKLGGDWRDELFIPTVSRCISVPFTSSRMISRQGCSIRTRKQQESEEEAEPPSGIPYKKTKDISFKLLAKGKTPELLLPRSLV